MRTVNFRDDVVYAIGYKMGMEPRKDLLVDQATAWVSFINHHVRQTYEKLDWPEWTLTEPRTPNATHYIIDVFDPDTGLIVPPNTPIGKVLKVYLRDPSITPPPIDSPFRLNEQGIWVGLRHGTIVWIKFIKRAPRYTFDPWLSTLTYGTGNLIYQPVIGGCFISKTSSNIGHIPPVTETDDANWEFVPFPLAICDEVVRNAYGDALRDDGQHDKAAAEEKEAATETRAGNFIAQPYDTLTDQHLNAPRYEVSK